MWWNRTQPPLVQPPAAAAPTDLEERVERLERRLKLLEADADVWISKYRTLLARTEKAAGRMERIQAEVDLEAPIGTAAGVTPLPPPPDRWVGLKRAQDAAARARGRG